MIGRTNANSNLSNGYTIPSWKCGESSSYVVHTLSLDTSKAKTLTIGSGNGCACMISTNTGSTIFNSTTQYGNASFSFNNLTLDVTNYESITIQVHTNPNTASTANFYNITLK